ncbi:NAD(P)H-dependent oxidoreductase [Candidatus Kaiserbacteria bacterium]|nr:MAG: NAD(P)H-dependent oxidoreductase [Candidatus Kaiserbacteria bacterium]
MNISIPVVLGTGRLERQSEKVARFVHTQLSGFEDVKSELVDVRNHLVSPFTIPAWVEDENAAKWRKIAHEAAGFVFVVPEYNRSFPGEFKLFFDSAFKEYKGKPAILVGVSSGQYGGVRVIQQLAPVLLAASIETLGDTIATSNVESLFNEEGIPTDERYIGFVNDALTALVTKLK